jgi:pSer/pThr/pTyr-binding forkhead associated (FHA) protein
MMAAAETSAYFEIPGAPPGAREFSISEVLATKPVLIIGSDARAHLRLTEIGIAPAHAIVEHYANRYLILPRFLHLEVFVNNVRVRGARELNTGDTIRIGKTELRFRLESESSNIDSGSQHDTILLLDAPAESQAVDV